jgi:hypothetical protein
MSTATAPAATAHAAHHKHEHKVPLWGLFLALLALTAAEVGLFEVWHASAHDGEPFIPKFAMVLLLLLFTLPKAAIVMIYFMHLKFEKQLVIALALLPFVTAGLAVLPTLTDVKTLDGHGQTYNKVPDLKDFTPHGGAGHGVEPAHGENAEH